MHLKVFSTTTLPQGYGTLVNRTELHPGTVTQQRVKSMSSREDSSLL